MGPENSDSLKVTSLIFNDDGSEITATELAKKITKAGVSDEDLSNALRRWYKNIFD